MNRFASALPAQVLILLFAVYRPAPTTAQVITAGIDALIGFPQGEFQDNIDHPGFGLGGNLGVQLGNLPFTAGLDLGLIVYGSESRAEPFSTTIPDVTVDVQTTNNIVLAHLFLRMQGQQGTFRPYIDGLFGLHYLFTETQIEDRNAAFNEPIASSTNQDDAAFSYGAGGGFMILLHEKKKPQGFTTDREVRTVLLNARVRYLLGSRSEYLKKGSIRRENGAVIYDLLTSRTDILTVQLGVSVQF